jgi:HEAT repeat protein
MPTPPRRTAALPTLLLLIPLAACSSGKGGHAASAQQSPAPTTSTQQGPGGTSTAAAPVPVGPAPTESVIGQQREKAAALLIAIATVPTTANTDPTKNALRANAIEGLLPMPGRLEPILRAAFTDKSIGIRSVAAMAMGKARVKSLVDAVSPLTADESPLVQAAAAFALARNGAPADLNVLAVMLTGNDARHRALAAYILGELGNKSAIPMLVAAASSQTTSKGNGVTEKLMHLQIAEALVKLGKSEAIDEVRAALYPAQPEDVEATILAVQIIGQVRDNDSRPQLHNLIAEGYKSSNPMPVEVRLAAGAALARLGAERPLAAVFAAQYLTSPTAAMRAQAAAVLGETRDTRQLALLAPLLADTDEQVRVSAAAAIIKITDGR